MAFEIENGVLKKYTEEQGVTEVVIPDGVTSIGNWAFSGCKSLTKIKIPDSVTSIGNSAFSGCSSLTEINIPDSVTNIGNYAFYECSSLTEINIPDSVTSIGYSAFYECSSLTEIKIPDSVTSIGNSAFYGTKWLNNYPDDLVIGGKVLVKYKGNAESVIIPDSVTSIGDGAFSRCSSLTEINIPDSVTSIGGSAFYECSSLTEIKIPDSVTSIGDWAFYGCSSLTEIKIPDSVTSIRDSAFRYCRSLTEINIPDSVTSIGNCAFVYCSSLTEINIPDSVTSIGSCAFSDCSSLTEIKIPDSVTSIGSGAFSCCESLKSVTIGNSITSIKKEAFDKNNPPKIIWSGGFENADDVTLKNYIIPNWDECNSENIAKLFIKKHSEPFMKLYKSFFKGEKLNEVGRAIIELSGSKPAAKYCNAAADFAIIFYAYVDSNILTEIYNKLKSFKTGTNAVEAIEKVPTLMGKMNIVSESFANVNSAEKAILTKVSEDEIFTRFNTLYKLESSCLPELRDKEGNVLSKAVLAWLLIVNDEWEKTVDDDGYENYNLVYNKPGFSPESAEVVDMLDQKSFQEALMKISRRYLGGKGQNSQHHLAYPICRYADENTLSELCRSAPRWRSHVSGNNSPALLTFRNACKYSTLRQAMFFAEKYKDLDQYAAIRGTDAETIRDTVLSDAGLSADGTKTYDLGNQTVTARIQSDYSFIVELENGKTAKSLPKKGADTTLYDSANKDFSEIKKNVKKVVKNRFNRLFEDFLSGETKDAESWNTVYTANPVLKQAAMLIVWAQGEKTFIMTKKGLVDSNENMYTLDKNPVKVAHPMEMQSNDVERWQKYFTLHSLKQPFQQIWEPVIDPKTIKSDRYEGYMIPFYRFTGQGKHGISVEDNDFHNEISIYFSGIDAYVERIDWYRHHISPNDCFEVKNISFSKYTRKVNHEIAYLDKITVWDRVRNDDSSVIDIMPNFTLAQIMEFISAAQEAKAINVLALLLEYKNNNFADFDPMEEFTLDW